MYARTRHNLTFHLTIAGFWIALAISVSSKAEAASHEFGFSGKEIFPVDYLISHLRSADLDGDGLEDLMVVNNLRSKITLLFNQTGNTNSVDLPELRQKREINELPSDSRFKIESIASEKRISSIVVADLNGDGLPDFAYYGEPKELVVQYNEGNRVWSSPKQWPLTDGLLNPNALTTGDLNGDHRTDLFLLAENHIYWLRQEQDHSLAEPSRIPYSGTIQAAQILDVQGDGLDDLLLVNWDSPNPFRFRLQAPNGHLGPEIHFPLPPIRSYWAEDLDGDRRAEVITIAQKSGRAQISHFKEAESGSELGGWKHERFDLFALNRTTKTERGIVFADINRDGLTDLLVAEPENGQLSAYLQLPNGSLDSPQTFPTLSGVSELRVADWDLDGHPDIFLLSLDERQIGVTRYESTGRIPFPKLLSVAGHPLRMDVGIIHPGEPPVVTVVADEEGKRSLQILRFNGENRKQALSDRFRSNPKSVLISDLNQDGRNDLVILIPYEKVKVLMQVSDGTFEEQDIAPPGGNTDLPWISQADVNGDGKNELLLAQRNFIRAVTVESSATGEQQNKWGFTVVDQINGVAGNSQIQAGATLAVAGNKTGSLFLLDTERKLLTICTRDSSGVWQVTRNLPLPVSDFTSLQAIGFGGREQNSLALIGVNAIGRITFQGGRWDFSELDGYESPIKNAYLHDVISGDLNNDGRKDLVFLETGKNYLDIVTYESPHKLVPSNRWQVFEERTFRNRGIASAEPREALIADFNNDKKNDLVVLVHDRIILYPQE
ncbi:MAG: VCBS repeat-containing protein [Verrucomicrobia bacterium]|nr:VCBS repeat-containing protein [Verrucomicrobiota bacterium]